MALAAPVALVDFGFTPREHVWLAGVTMVSNVPFWSFKEVNWKKRVPLWVILACVVAILVVASRPSLVLFALFMAYGLSGYVMCIVAARPKDSHDVLGVFRLALQSPWRETVPPLAAEFPKELAARHAVMLEKRPEANPGEFKLEPNRGGTWFVEPQFVRGTLIEGSELARSVPEGLARAIYLAFLISEVHPFLDGNGRISRLVMNAELSRTGEARTIIPTLFHEEYVDCQRQLSRQDNPEGHIRALTLMQAWTLAFDYSDIDALISSVKKTNALERARSQFKLTMPDGPPISNS